jgi:hypothetical protein
MTWGELALSAALLATGDATAYPDTLAGQGVFHTPHGSPTIFLGTQTGIGAFPQVAPTPTARPASVVGTGVLPVTSAAQSDVTTLVSSVTGTGVLFSPHGSPMAVPLAMAGVGYIPAMDTGNRTTYPPSLVGVGVQPQAEILEGAYPAVLVGSWALGWGAYPSISCTHIPLPVEGEGVIGAVTAGVASVIVTSQFVGNGVLPAVTMHGGWTVTVASVVGTGVIGAPTIVAEIRTLPAAVVGVGAVPIPVIDIDVSPTAIPDVLIGLGVVPTTGISKTTFPDALIGYGVHVAPIAGEPVGWPASAELILLTGATISLTDGVVLSGTFGKVVSLSGELR